MSGDLAVRDGFGEACRWFRLFFRVVTIDPVQQTLIGITLLDLVAG